VVAREMEVETIVVGKHGTELIARLLIGSASQKCVNVTARPVVVVP